jgi:hypothetical protein
MTNPRLAAASAPLNGRLRGGRGMTITMMTKTMIMTTVRAVEARRRAQDDRAVRAVRGAVTAMITTITMIMTTVRLAVAVRPE